MSAAPVTLTEGWRDFMTSAARLLLLAGTISSLAGCASPAAKPAAPKSPVVVSADALLPSPRIIIGRVIAVDQPQGFAILEVAADAPADALVDGAELLARTLELRETARLRASRYLRGRTLGTMIAAGQPTPGDEVVWLAP